MEIHLFFSQARPRRPTPNTATTMLISLLWAAYEHAQSARRNRFHCYDSRWVTIGPWKLSLHIQTGGADHVQSNPVIQGENKQGEGLQVTPRLPFFFLLFNISKPHNHLTGIQAPAATSFQCNIALLCAELVVKVNCVTSLHNLPSEPQNLKKIK